MFLYCLEDTNMKIIIEKQSAQLALNRPWAHVTPYTLNTSHYPFYEVLDLIIAALDLFFINSINRLLGGKKETFKKAHSGHSCPQCNTGRAGHWLTVSILFPLVPQSPNLSTVNKLSVHSLTFPSFQSAWKTSKNHEKNTKMPRT